MEFAPIQNAQRMLEKGILVVNELVFLATPPGCRRYSNDSLPTQLVFFADVTFFTEGWTHCVKRFSSPAGRDHVRFSSSHCQLFLRNSESEYAARIRSAELWFV